MSPPLTAAIMIVGNEILSGRTQDVNVQFIATRLSLRGIKLAEVRVVRDEENAIVSTVQDLCRKYTYVFSTGGIGPTHDDITAECMAKAFNTPLEINAAAKGLLEKYYQEKNIVLNEGRLRMARIPAGASLIDNAISTAPGFKLQNVYVLAGVPHIMQAMFHSFENTLAQGAPMMSNTIMCSLREGDIALELEALQKKHGEVEIGSYPAQTPSGPSLSLVLRATHDKKLAAATEDVFAMIRKIDPDASVAYQRL